MDFPPPAPELGLVALPDVDDDSHDLYNEDELVGPYPLSLLAIQTALLAVQYDEDQLLGEPRSEGLMRTLGLALQLFVDEHYSSRAEPEATDRYAAEAEFSSFTPQDRYAPLPDTASQRTTAIERPLNDASVTAASRAQAVNEVAPPQYGPDLNGPTMLAGPAEQTVPMMIVATTRDRSQQDVSISDAAEEGLRDSDDGRTTTTDWQLQVAGITASPVPTASGSGQPGPHGPSLDDGRGLEPGRRALDLDLGRPDDMLTVVTGPMPLTAQGAEALQFLCARFRLTGNLRNLEEAAIAAASFVKALGDGYVSQSSEAGPIPTGIAQSPTAEGKKSLLSRAIEKINISRSSPAEASTDHKNGRRWRGALDRSVHGAFSAIRRRPVVQDE